MENEYKEPYYILLGALEDIINAIDNHNFGTAKELIIKAQLNAEQAFITFGEK